MQIDKVTITDAEINEAIGEWIKTKGIQIPVERVYKKFIYSSDWAVEFVDQNPPKPIPTPEVEELKG